MSDTTPPIIPKNHRKRNTHYVNDQFWKREPISLTREQLGTNYGWKTLLILQFQYQFQIIVLGGISFSAVVVLKDLSFAVSNTKELPELYEAKVAATIYIFDVVYALDILLMIIYKNITWHEIDYLYSERPGYIVILEFLSVLPYEIQLTPDNPVFHYMRARYVLRVVRIVYISKLTSKMSMENTGLKLFINFSNRIFVLTFIFTFIVAVSYSMTEKVHLTTEIFHNIMIVTSSRVTNKGFGEATNLKTSIHYYEYTILTYIHLISFIIVSYQVCYYACILVPGMKHASKFAHRFEEINLILKRWKNDVDMKNFHLSFKKTVLNYFRMSWQKNKRQFHRYVPSEIVPDIIVKEIALDVTWDAFKHSHLFKNVSVSFLRSLSVFMQRNVYYPGEIVIKKNMMKSSMVYVISGIIQILSEENGETPIMSLSGGSCIGESSLFIDYPSTCTVVAKSCTEVYTLKRKNVISICKFYPDIYRLLTKKITRRYKKAKLYQRAFQILKRKYQLIDDIDFLPIYYVIKTLRGFGKTDRIINREHQRLSSILDDFVFCADYLDLLVLPDELHLVSDTVFVSETFPFIFQPNSVFIEMWNFIVGFIACIMVILYPLAVCSIAGEKFTRYVMLIILIISFIWIIDAYIRVSTAVNTKHAFHTKMSDIFYYRLSTMGFLVDILCCIPVGPVLYIINTTMSTHTLLLLEIHKLLKVYRINDAVQKLTELNTKKMMIITYLKILSILFLLFYYSTCIFYLLVCQKDCNKTFLGYLESFYEIEQTNAPERFILLYTLASYFVSDTSVFSFMDVLPYNHFFIVLFMQIFYCCMYIYAQSIVIAAEVSTSQETFEFKEYMSNVDVMFAKVKFPEETNKKVFKYLKKQYYLDKGVSFLYDDAVCKEMTKNLHILYKYIMFGKHVNDILIFSDLQNNLLMEIARRSDINTYLSGEVICYAGEVCKYMYFIICGFCKVIYRNGVEKVITVKDSISSFELCMEIPHINTVIACTDCKLLALNSKEFSYVLKWHPELKREFDEMRNRTDTIAINRLLAEEVKRIPPKPVYKKKSFKYFKFTKKKSDNMDFHVGFPKLWIIFKYLLMRATIIPDSKFLIAFELFRGIFAFFSNALSATAVFYQTSAIFYSLIALDIISWIDIYVMHHVCYYNANGLLVFHPLSTAKYYWKNRFMFDFIACLPIDYLFLDHYLYIYLRLNRFLQLYRVLMVLKHLDLRQLSNTHFFDIMKYLPLAILSIYYLSSVILISTCMTPKFQLKNSVECATGYFVTKRMPNATYAPSNALVANFLLTVMSFAMINTTKIRLEQVKEMIMYSFVVLIGTGFSIWLTAKVVAGNFFR
nr:uncharacterized protein LOC111417566 [Onthophagus taurus]